MSYFSNHFNLLRDLLKYYFPPMYMPAWVTCKVHIYQGDMYSTYKGDMYSTYQGDVYSTYRVTCTVHTRVTCTVHTWVTCKVHTKGTCTVYTRVTCTVHNLVEPLDCYGIDRGEVILEQIT